MAFLLSYDRTRRSKSGIKQSLRHSSREPVALMRADSRPSSGSGEESAEVRSEQRAATAINNLLERWHIYLRQRDSHRARYGECNAAADVVSAGEAPPASSAGPVHEPFCFNAFDPLLFEPPACHAAVGAARDISIGALRSWALRHHQLPAPPTSPSIACHADAIRPDLTVAQFHRPQPHMTLLRASVQRWRRAESDRRRGPGVRTQEVPPS